MYCINTQIINISRLFYADSNGGIFVLLRWVNPEIKSLSSHPTYTSGDTNVTDETYTDAELARVSVLTKTGDRLNGRVMKRRVILESYDFGELCVNHAQPTPTFTKDHTQFLKCFLELTRESYI